MIRRKKPRSEQRIVKAALRLYRYWAKSADPVFWPEGFWYPLGSKKQAIPFGKACAAHLKEQKND